MAESTNNIISSNIHRESENEFPKQRVCEFLISSIQTLKQQYGEQSLFVSN